MGGQKYLASRHIVTMRADTWGLEAVPGEDREQVLPVHPELLAKNDVDILENMGHIRPGGGRGWEVFLLLGRLRAE